MTSPASLKECNSLLEFNKFMKEDVKIIVSPHAGRKFKIKGKDYTMNQIVSQFAQCIKNDSATKEFVGKHDARTGYERVQALQESGTEKITAKMGEGKLSKAGALGIKMRQAFGNFFSKLHGLNKEKILGEIQDELNKAGIKDEDIRGSIDLEKVIISANPRVLRQDIGKTLKKVFADAIPENALSKLNVEQLEKLKANLQKIKQALKGKKLELSDEQKAAFPGMLRSFSKEKIKLDYIVEHFKELKFEKE